MSTGIDVDDRVDNHVLNDAEHGETGWPFHERSRSDTPPVFESRGCRHEVGDAGLSVKRTMGLEPTTPGLGSQCSTN